MNKLGRVVMFAPVPPPYSGPEIASRMLLDHLPRERIEIHHVVSSIRQQNSSRGVLNMSGVLRFMKVYIRLVWVLLTKRVDLLYFLLSSNRVGFTRDLFVIGLAQLFRVAVVAHYRGGFFGEFYKKQGTRFQVVIRIAMRPLRLVICQAQGLRSMFEGVIEPSKVVVLYNGLVPPTLPQAKPNSVRTSTRTQSVLFIGHLTFAKGFFDLIEAWGQIRVQTNAILRFAGEPWGSEKSQKLVRNYLSGKALLGYESHSDHIESRIAEFVSNPSKFGAEYLGLISEEEKHAEFLRADLFVLPSYSEGFSMSVLEALSYGLPVVTTPVGALGEVVTHDENGLIVPVGEPRELSQAICRLLTDHALRESMAKENPKYVCKRFHVERIAQELEELLASAANRD